jgi:hypothetical protein
MSEQNHSHAGEHTARRCAICELTEAAGRFMEAFGPSEKVTGHFKQSKIEFLKGVRAMIDEKLEDLSDQPVKGSRVVID